MLINSFKAVYSYLYCFYCQRQANRAKRRSELALQRLDDRLLDDIGLCRNGSGEIVTEKEVLGRHATLSIRANPQQSPTHVLTTRLLAKKGLGRCVFKRPHE